MRRLEVRRLDERRFAVPLRRRVLHAFFAAADLFAFVLRLVVRRLEVRRFAAPRFAALRRLLELRLRVAAAFFAALERFAALRLRVAAALRAALRRLALVEDLREDLRDARRLVVFLPALRRRVRHAFFAAADLFAFVVLRAGDFLAPLFLLVVVFLFVLVLAILVFPLAEERLFLFPFGGLTRTSSPSAIE